ncbi:MAG TPA: TIR domain-containing protein [Pyrinomonadaceae bacterium]|nr:TIR domain-containing protein [Pyrinomonadaceae bacterium]
MRPQDKTNRTVEVFCSYSHHDSALRGELHKHLRPLIREQIIRTWHDGEIGAGDEWPAEIRRHLDSADIILLLISADFLSSDYIWDNELPRAMQRHEAGEATVIPIILRKVDDFGTLPFSKLQALPSNAKPVASWLDRDEAFTDIARGVREKIVEMGGVPRASQADDDSPAESDINIPRLVPYLCNRSDQERELTHALQEHQATIPRRPFVCIVHGDEFECHSEFLERMQHTSISRSLNLTAKQLSPEEYSFPWPSPDVPPQRYVKVFESNLGASLLQNSAASPDSIIKSIALNERPLLLTSNLLTENFQTSGTALFDALLNFWDAWPDLPPGRTLINFVCLKHQHFEMLSFFQKRKMQKLEERLRTYLTTLDWPSHAGQYGVLLTELKAIQRSDVEDWARHPAVRAVRRIGENEIRALYERGEICTADGLISMEKLATELRSLLSQNRQQRG